MNRPQTIAFVVTEDWFFVSHFLPMLQAARNANLKPIVITRVRDHRTTIEMAGARVIELDADRRTLNPFAVISTVFRLSRIMRDEKVESVHLIALRSILVGGLAAVLSGVRHRVFAVTGGGLLLARTDFFGRIATRFVVRIVRGLLQNRATQYLFENEDDPRIFGLEPSAPQVTIVGGAGVDPAFYRPEPFPPFRPLKIAIVSRMLWSKGIDIAVDAVSIARLRGAEVELSLYGEPDASNPRAIPVERLREWSQLDGIEWHGVSSDPREVWASHHVACLPSRGGEGLPRTLLEAAACGRAILTTDVPGCRSFVRDGQDGFVVSSEDAEALANRIMRLERNPDTITHFGQSARERVEGDYTEAAVIDRVAEMYSSR